MDASLISGVQKEDNNTFLYISYVVLLGSCFPIMRYTSIHFDTVNNNAIRFLAGGILFLIMVIARYRNEVSKLLAEPVMIVKLLLIGVLMTVNMYFFMNGMQLTTALTGSIFSILGMPVATIMASIFFADERKKAANPRFIIGCLLSIAGSFIFIFNADTTGNSENFILGSAFWVLAITIAAMQNLLVKNLAKDLHPVVISASTATIAGLIYLFIATATGKIQELSTTPESLIIFLIMAVMYGMLVGMLMAFYIIRKSGVITFNMLQIMAPLSTAIIAYITLGETISTIQAFGAAIVVFGCTHSLKANRVN